MLFAIVRSSLIANAPPLVRSSVLWVAHWPVPGGLRPRRMDDERVWFRTFGGDFFTYIFYTYWTMPSYLSFRTPFKLLICIIDTISFIYLSCYVLGHFCSSAPIALRPSLALYMMYVRNSLRTQKYQHEPWSSQNTHGSRDRISKARVLDIDILLFINLRLQVSMLLLHTNQHFETINIS